MTLFVVMHWNLDGDFETTSLKGVFDDREKARTYIQENQGYPANNEWYILERDLNKGT